MTATSTRSRVKKWPGYSCILLSRAICFCGCSVQNMACLEIETQLQSTTETETQFSISMQFANLQSQIVYASCKWSWLANVLHRFSRSQGSARSTDVIIGRTETKNKIEVGIFVPVKSYWSPYSGFRIPVPDFKGSHNSCFLVLLRQHGKARVSWVTQFPQTNARYTVNCFTERLKSFKYSEFSDGLERDCCDRSLTFFKNIWLRRRKTRRWVASNQGFGLRGEIIPP